MVNRQCREQSFLLVLFTMWFVATLYDAPYPLHAAIHVAPTWLAILALALAVPELLLSTASYARLLGFLVLHVVGTRYVYSQVPYDEWFQYWFQGTLSEAFHLQRNHYDRFVHLMFGVLVTPVAAEIGRRYGQGSACWCQVVAFLFVAASSALFEVVEWLGAIHFAPEEAHQYLGQQGDPWDAQQDMALAILGSIAGVVVMNMHLWLRHNHVVELRTRADSETTPTHVAAGRRSALAQRSP